MMAITHRAAERRRHPRHGSAKRRCPRTQPSSDHRIYLGDTIVAELRAARLPLEPRQFEFWFAYKSGRNAALNAAADEIRTRDGALDRRRTSTGCTRPISRPGAWANGPRPRSRALGAKLQDLALTLEGAIGSAQEQRETLAAETAELSINGALTLQDVLGAIDRLTQSTKESPGPLRAARSPHRRGDPRGRRAATAARRGARRNAAPIRPPRCRPARPSTATLAKALGGGRRDAPAGLGHAVQSRLLRGLQREFRHLSWATRCCARSGCCSRRTCAPATRSRALPATHSRRSCRRCVRARRSPARNVSARC